MNEFDILIKEEIIYFIKPVTISFFLFLLEDFIKVDAVSLYFFGTFSEGFFCPGYHTNSHDEILNSNDAFSRVVSKKP